MAITTIDGLVEAMAVSPMPTFLYKASRTSQTAGKNTSLWLASGVPGAGNIPTTAAVCTKDTVGAIPFVNVSGALTQYLALTNASTSVIGTYLLADRLCHMGGLSGTSTSAQTVSLDATSAGRTSVGVQYVQWFVEWYVATGSYMPSITCSYTDQDDDPGHTATVDTLATNMAASRMLQIFPEANSSIKSIQTLTLELSTGVVGNFGVTAIRPIAVIHNSPAANIPSQYDWQSLGLPVVFDDSCFMVISQASSTASGNFQAKLNFVQG